MSQRKIHLLSVVFFAIAFTVNGQIVKDKVHFSKEDKDLYTLVEKQTFQYFWDGAEPTSGMARERFHVDGIYPDNDKNVVTTGGSGFSVMAILAGINQKFITREEGRKRFEKIISFLEKADRFHGAWSHWIYGETGKVKPFGRKDNGGDLVETSFMLQGLLCVRQYFKNGNAEEKILQKELITFGKKSTLTGLEMGRMFCIGIGARNIIGK